MDQHQDLLQGALAGDRAFDLDEIQLITQRLLVARPEQALGRRFQGAPPARAHGQPLEFDLLTDAVEPAAESMIDRLPVAAERAVGVLPQRPGNAGVIVDGPLHGGVVAGEPLEPLVKLGPAVEVEPARGGPAQPAEQGERRGHQDDSHRAHGVSGGSVAVFVWVSWRCGEPAARVLRN